MSSKRPTTGTSRSGSRFTPALERLEDRTLLAAGDLDPTFGAGGWVAADFAGSLHDTAAAAVVQPDGKVVVGGTASNISCCNPNYEHLALARYNADGSLDPGFGTGGRVLADFGDDASMLRTLTVQADGRILAIGTSKWSAALARFLPDGRPDGSFGRNGVVLTGVGNSQTPSYLFRVLRNGKIAVTGNLTPGGGGYVISLLNSDGTPDAGFGAGGRVEFQLTPDLRPETGSALVEQEGKIVLVVTASRIGDSRAYRIAARFNQDGSLDRSFGTEGKIVTDLLVTSIFTRTVAAVQPDGKLILASQPDERTWLNRYHTDGRLDATFGTAGRVITDTRFGPRAILTQPDGKLLLTGLAGSPVGFAALRLHADGQPDTGFGTNGLAVTVLGIPVTDARAALLQHDGKLLVAGDVGQALGDWALVRYTGSGATDPSFGTDGRVRTDFVGSQDNSPHSVLVQPDGKIVLGQTTIGGGSSFLFRYLPNGALDLDFGNGGRLDLPAAGNVVHLSDGKMLISGTENGTGRLTRHLPDGRIDTAFGSNGRVVTNSRQLTSLMTQQDGRILFVGDSLVIARHNPDGSPDLSFGNGGQTTVSLPDSQGILRQVAIGNILSPTASLLLYVGPCRDTLVRLTERGQVDPGFRIVGGSTRCLFPPSRDGGISVGHRPLPDGKILSIVTTFGRFGPIATTLTRLNTNGTPDETFQAARIAFDSRLQLLSDGKLLALSSTALVRLTSNGRPDPDFGTNGVTTMPGDLSRISYASHVFQPDGKLVVISTTRLASTGFQLPQVVFTRFLGNGQLDHEFGGAGQALTPPRSQRDTVVGSFLTPHGKLLVFGTSVLYGRGADITLSRYLLEGPAETPNQRYVRQLYQSILQRPADGGGLALFAGLLNRGQASPAQIVTAIATSTEYRTLVIQELYRNILLRPADPAGLAAFLAILSAGGSFAQVKAAIFSSVEFAQRFGPGNWTGFVSGIYQRVLGRNLDPLGGRLWAGALEQGVSPRDVAYAIVISPEALRRVGQEDYRQWLRRDADPAGLNNLVNLMQASFSIIPGKPSVVIGGTRLEFSDADVLVFFLTSAEYTGVR